jgi:hypothetical protein
MFMSGFDTSQPITDEAALREVDAGEHPIKEPGRDNPPLKPADPPAEPEELGDATPGPR